MTTRSGNIHFDDVHQESAESNLLDEPYALNSMINASDVLNCTSLAFLLVLMISAF